MSGLFEKLNHFGIAVSLGCTVLSWWIPNRLLSQFDGINATVRQGTDLLVQDLLLQRGWSLYQTAADARSEALTQQAQGILEQATSLSTAYSDPIRRHLLVRLPPRDTEHRVGLSSVVEQLGVELHENGTSTLQAAAARSLDFVTSQKRVLQGIFLLTLLLNVFLLVQSRLTRRQRSLVLELSAKQRLQNALFSSLREGIIMCDPAGSIGLCNDSAAIIFGVKARRLVGLALPQLVPVVCDEKGESTDFQASELGALLKGRQVVTGHVFGFLRGGLVPLWVSVNAQPIVLEGEQPDPRVILSMTDITDKVSAARMADLQRLQLAHADRLRVMGELVSGIAHEINNPIGAISMIAENLGTYANGNTNVEAGVVKRSVEKIVRLVTRSAKITQSMLRMSRSQENDPPQLVTAKEIVADALEIASYRLKNQAVTLEMPEGLESISIECQPTQIGQVVLNLIKNAIDSLSTMPEEKERWIRVEVVESGGMVEFRISDSGPGIPPDVRKKILEPYFTTKARGKGTGLGLSISRAIASRHGGSLTLDPNLSITKFVLALPKKAPAPTKEPAAA